MKKFMVGVSIFTAILLIFLLVQNNRLKDEKIAVESALTSAEENEEEETPNVLIHTDAGEAGEAFVNGYFNYTQHAKREAVEPYMTSNVEELLSFDEPQGVEEALEVEEVDSEVKNLKVYYGQSTNERQELYVVFDNEISFNSVTSSVASYMELDMVLTDGSWKVDRLTFDQH